MKQQQSNGVLVVKGRCSVEHRCLLCIPDQSRRHRCCCAPYDWQRPGYCQSSLTVALLKQNSGRLSRLIQFYHRLFCASAANAQELNCSRGLTTWTVLSCSVSNTGVEIRHERRLWRPGLCQTLPFYLLWPVAEPSTFCTVYCDPHPYLIMCIWPRSC